MSRISFCELNFTRCMTPAPKLLKPPTLELRTLGSSSVQKAAAVDNERVDSALVATNASGVELRVD